MYGLYVRGGWLVLVVYVLAVQFGRVWCMDTKLTVRVSVEELEAWKVAAHVRRTSLSDWVRQVLSATAAVTKEGDGG